MLADALRVEPGVQPALVAACSFKLSCMRWPSIIRSYQVLAAFRVQLHIVGRQGDGCSFWAES